MQLSDPSVDSVRVQRLGSEYTRIQAQLEEHIHQWSNLGVRLNK